MFTITESRRSLAYIILQGVCLQRAGKLLTNDAEFKRYMRMYYYLRHRERRDASPRGWHSL